MYVFFCKRVLLYNVKLWEQLILTQVSTYTN